MQAIQLAQGIDPHEVLETGNVLILPDAPLRLSAEDRELIQGIRQSGGYHKNISYKPRQDKLSGLDKTPAPTRERLHAILRQLLGICCCVRCAPFAAIPPALELGLCQPPAH
jgi:hypothetical protein